MVLSQPAIQAAAGYTAWISMAWVGNPLLENPLPAAVASTLVIGILITNLLLGIASRQPLMTLNPASTAIAHALFATLWAGLYTLACKPEFGLVLAIHASIMIFALAHIPNPRLLAVLFAQIVCLGVVHVASEPASSLLDNAERLLDYLVFMTLMVLVWLSGSQLQQPRSTASLPVSTVRHQILDTLTREKGRADRFNTAFSVCLFKVDTPENNALNDYQKNAIVAQTEDLLRHELRAMDLFGRTGFRDCFGAFSDGEFVAILPQTNLNGATSASERLAAKLSEAYAGQSDVRLSGGVAQYCRGQTIAELLADAEVALGEALKNPESQICSCQSSEPRQAEIVRLRPH